MEVSQADVLALSLAKHLIKTNHSCLLSQTNHYDTIADEVVSLVEALSRRLQQSDLKIDVAMIRDNL